MQQAAENTGRGKQLKMQAKVSCLASVFLCPVGRGDPAAKGGAEAADRRI